MMKTLTFHVFLALFMAASMQTVISVPDALAATPQVSPQLIAKAKNGGKLTDKERLELSRAGLINSQGVWIGDKLKAANPVAQGNRVNQGTVTPDDPRPAEMRPYRANGGGYECEAGYYCVTDHSGVTMTCKLDRNRQHTNPADRNCTQVSQFCQRPEAEQFDQEHWDEVCNG